MKRSPAIFLQVIVVLVGIGAIALLLWEPQIEGRNKHATLFEVYFKDPFLAYVYVASIPFFVAVVQAFKVLGYAGRNQIFSQVAVRSLRTIKRCAPSVPAANAAAIGAAWASPQTSRIDSGASPSATSARAAAAMCRSRRASSRSRSAVVKARAWAPNVPSSNPPAAPAHASIALSVSSSRATRPRPAPIASRSAISR